MQKIKAFQFDIDGNTFHMDTVAHIQVKKNKRFVRESVNAQQFAKYQDEKNPFKFTEEWMREFRDDKKREDDFQKMLKKWPIEGFGFVEPDFRDALLNCEELSFNTSRGHSTKAITASIKQYIIKTFDRNDREYMNDSIREKVTVKWYHTMDAMLDEYFNTMFRVYAVRSTEFVKLVGLSDAPLLPVEQLKPIAYQHYIDYLTQKYGDRNIIAVGFSEDTKKYVDSVEQHIKDIILPNPAYSHIYPVLYHTFSPMKSTKIILRTEGEVRKNLLAKSTKM